MKSSPVQVHRSKDTTKGDRFWLEAQKRSGESNPWITIPLKWTQKAQRLLVAVENSLTGKRGGGEKSDGEEDLDGESDVPDAIGQVAPSP